MSCTFLDTSTGARPVEDQILDYLLTLVPVGMGNLMKDEILFIVKEEDAQDLVNDLCSDFQFIKAYGNNIEYIYSGITVVIYKI